MRCLAIISLAAAAIFLVPAGVSYAQPAPTQGVDEDRLALIDNAVTDAIADGQLPGAVVLVSHQGQTVYHKAFGHRILIPTPEPMTLNTVFDLASLTKVVATTTSVMALVEEGRVRLRDPVAHYIPGFERHGKKAVTIEHLLTHTSGLRPDLPLEEEFSGYATAIARAIDERLVASPGTVFSYSDINFFVLGEVVARVSGMQLDQFAQLRIFGPLGMRDTTFRPPVRLHPRVAATEACTPLGWPCGGPGAVMLRGIVHDPTARRMGGVAGHAGLFATAADLARFGVMLLSGGSLTPRGEQILTPQSIARMTAPATPSDIPDRRGLGWDIDSRYSGNRGDLFSTRSFGHTGFTGTSIWLDPLSETIVVFLSARVHPDGSGNVTTLRGRVATLAAAAVLGVPLELVGTARNEGERSVRVDVGIDVLREEGFARLRGKQVGLLTNQTGRARDGVSTIDLLHEASDVDLRVLLSPEHGLHGDLDTTVTSSRDTRTGLPIHSLYGKTRRPTSAMLQGLDVLVVDLQDVGSRFYTYATTMAYVMEEATDRGIKVVVLDRPNPITGAVVEGPLLDDDPAVRGFTGYFSMPVRHGMTIGELAHLFVQEQDLGTDLEVVAMRGWRRLFWFDETGLAWVNPSPNLRSLNQATLYPGIGAIEGTNLSVGRGTDMPFEQVGAPWIDGTRLALALNARGLPGVRFYPVSFTPRSSTYAGQDCGGIFHIIIDRRRLRPVRLGLEIAAALYRLYPGEFELAAAARLLGSRAALDRLRSGADPAVVAAEWDAGEAAWRELRAPYLLYQ